MSNEREFTLLRMSVEEIGSENFFTEFYGLQSNEVLTAHTGRRGEEFICKLLILSHFRYNVTLLLTASAPGLSETRAETYYETLEVLPGV